MKNYKVRLNLSAIDEERVFTSERGIKYYGARVCMFDEPKNGAVGVIKTSKQVDGEWKDTIIAWINEPKDDFGDKVDTLSKATESVANDLPF